MDILDVPLWSAHICGNPMQKRRIVQTLTELDPIYGQRSVALHEVIQGLKRCLIAMVSQGKERTNCFHAQRSRVLRGLTIEVNSTC